MLSQPTLPDTDSEPNCTPRSQIGPSEACLLRYFVEELARWFDICDPFNHFASIIPQRARECLTLRHAVLAASARHFSTLSTDRQTDTFQKYNMKHDITIDEETVLYYHNQCIADLRSLADQPDAIMDENLLAAVVILQFYEELDNSFVTLPTETATRGLHVFIDAQARTALFPTPTPTPASNSNVNCSLQQAVFWMGFRQEFHIAFSQQRPFRLPLSLSPTRDHLVWIPAIDAIWTSRLLIIGAQVIQYCYDDTSPGYASVAGYQELSSLRDRWVRSRPASFAPIYIEQPNPEENMFFPGTWYLDDCHIVAAQTLRLLDILFIAYSPYIPRIGAALHLEIKNVDEKLRTAVLEICGIAISNKQSAPALTTACIAVSICAERFVGSGCGVERALMGVVVGMGSELNYCRRGLCGIGWR